MTYGFKNNIQRRSQNLNEVKVQRKLLTLMTSQLMTSYRETNISMEKNLSSIVITDAKLAWLLKKDLEFCFSFIWQEHYHSKIPVAWLCVYVSITVLF